MAILLIYLKRTTNRIIIHKSSYRTKYQTRRLWDNLKGGNEKTRTRDTDSHIVVEDKHVKKGGSWYPHSAAYEVVTKVVSVF